MYVKSGSLSYLGFFLTCYDTEEMLGIELAVVTENLVVYPAV